MVINAWLYEIRRNDRFPSCLFLLDNNAVIIHTKYDKQTNYGMKVDETIKFIRNEIYRFMDFIASEYDNRITL